MALCFIHMVQHKGAAVIQGRKYVLRSDIMYSNSEDGVSDLVWYTTWKFSSPYGELNPIFSL